jgi:hypothetical protein
MGLFIVSPVSLLQVLINSCSLFLTFTQILSKQLIFLFIYFSFISNFQAYKFFYSYKKKTFDNHLNTENSLNSHIILPPKPFSAVFYFFLSSFFFFFLLFIYYYYIVITHKHKSPMGWTLGPRPS